MEMCRIILWYNYLSSVSCPDWRIGPSLKPHQSPPSLRQDTRTGAKPRPYVVLVKLHPSGCLYFCSRINEWGIYNCDGVPTNPVVSLATDSDGHLLLIHHNNGDTPAVVFPFHGKKQEQDSSVKMVSRSELSWYERDRYLEESYMDAFEGDTDAYWNID